jgi:hypothetical protein
MENLSPFCPFALDSANYCSKAKMPIGIVPRKGADNTTVWILEEIGTGKSAQCPLNFTNGENGVPCDSAGPQARVYQESKKSL